MVAGWRQRGAAPAPGRADQKGVVAVVESVSARPRAQREPRPAATGARPDGGRPDPAADVVAMAQVGRFAQTGRPISRAAARTIAAWWMSPSSGAINALATSGTVTHWLAYECEQELKGTREANRPELEALVAFARFHAGYAYETVVFLDGDDFDEADKTADAHESSWVDGMVDYLLQWEYGEPSERYATPPWGFHDDEYFRDGYVLAVNHGMGYVSLQRIITEPGE